MGSIEKLLIYDATRSRTTAHVFIAHPSPAEDRALGQLGFVAELGSNERIYQELLSRLQDFVKAAYYTSPEVHADVAFEHTVQACNRYIGELAADFGTAWVDQLSMVLFTVCENTVHFTDVGRLVGFLIHGKHVVDLLGNQRASSRKVNPMKLFTSIASGSLQAEDAIFFGTANLLDFFSIERIRRTVVESPMGGGARQLEQTLRADPTYAAFASVILQRRQAPVPVQPTEPTRTFNVPGAPQRSLESMLAQSAQTQAFLTPSLWPAVKRITRKVSRALYVQFRSLILRKPTRTSPVFERPEEEDLPIRPRAGVVVQPQNVRQTFTGPKRNVIAQVPKFLWERSRQAISATPKLVSALGRLAHTVRRAPQQLPTNIEQQVADVRGLPQRSRLLFYGTVAVAAIFAITLITVGIQRNRHAKSEAKQATITSIQSAIEQAKSSIIYGDEDRARELLQQAQTDLNTLPTSSASDKSTHSTLADSIQTTLEQTRHIVSTAPATTATLPEGITGTGLVLLGKNLFTADTKTNQLYEVTTDGTVSKLAVLPGDIGLQELTSYGSGSLMSLALNTQLIEQRASTKAGTRYTFTLPSATPNLVGLNAYNAALYTVDVASNAILRATKSGTGFTALAWLKESATLDQAVDLAVDGSLYILLKDGGVQKFTQGRRVQLALSTIDPQLTDGSKLVGDTTVQNLYVLDPVGKRIVVFTKAGKFVNQYVHDSLANATALAVDERNQKIYVLVDQTVEAFSIAKTK